MGPWRFTGILLHPAAHLALERDLPALDEIAEPIIVVTHDEQLHRAAVTWINAFINIFKILVSIRQAYIRVVARMDEHMNLLLLEKFQRAFEVAVIKVRPTFGGQLGITDDPHAQNLCIHCFFLLYRFRRAASHSRTKKAGECQTNQFDQSGSGNPFFLHLFPPYFMLLAA